MISLCMMILMLLVALTTTQGNVIDILSSCSDSISNEMDRAKIYFSSSDHKYNLYAVNAECYRCSKTLVSNGTTENCASLYTPHEWTLYLETEDGVETASKLYTFGESGEYMINGDDNAIIVTETKSPVNSLEPLWILIGILIVIIIIAFSGPHVLQLIKERWFGVDPSMSSAPTYAAVPLTGNDTEPSSADLEQHRDAKVVPAVPKKPARLLSLDTFRGFSLCLMIFVNYGSGGYWFFDHADWNGLTFADLVFPWFMWMMGVSMALSFASLLPKAPRSSDEGAAAHRPVELKLWLHVFRRSAILFLLGMFIANGWEYTTWRVPGVLQYFAVSYLVTSCTVLAVYPYTRTKIQAIVSAENKSNNGGSQPGSYFDLRSYPVILSAYSYEWLIQGAILLVFLAIALGAKAPGCPRGYNGPGGISEQSENPMCTGGIHRYIDMHAFGYNFIYHHPTCLAMYQCRPYDPEGLLGSLSACTLTYLGLMSGRVVLHFKTHKERLSRWAAWSFCLLLLGGILCGFSQNGGAIPVNKNLWSTSFVLVTAGSGLIGLSACYVLVDVLKWWSGAPFLYLGMNSILIYVSHGILEGYMPFSYKIYDLNHGTKLQCNVLGVTAWMIVAYYFYRIKFFVKI